MKPVFEKRVCYHETDCMGVVHHSVYAKYLEEARVELLHTENLHSHHSPYFDYVLAVLKMELVYIKPLRLFDHFVVHMDSYWVSDTRLQFEYEIYKGKELMTKGKTLHVGLDKDLKVAKPPEALRNHWRKKGQDNG